MWGTFCGLLVLAPETCHLVTKEKRRKEGWPGARKWGGNDFSFFLIHKISCKPWLFAVLRDYTTLLQRDCNKPLCLLYVVKMK